MFIVNVVYRYYSWVGLLVASLPWKNARCLPWKLILRERAFRSVSSISGTSGSVSEVHDVFSNIVLSSERKVTAISIDINLLGVSQKILKKTFKQLFFSCLFSWVAKNHRATCLMNDSKKFIGNTPRHRKFEGIWPWGKNHSDAWMAKHVKEAQAVWRSLCSSDWVSKSMEEV